MSWTKRQFVEEAFTEIGQAPYVYDLSPEQLQMALRRLDSMIASWNDEGIRIGYPLPSSPENSTLDTETEVPDRANEAIITNLAIQIAPSQGKEALPSTKKTARDSYNQLLANFAVPNEMQFPQTLPRGSGNKPWRYTDDRFFPKPKPTLDVGTDNELDFD